MRKLLAVAASLCVGVALSPGSASAINHTTDYKTNIQNYRYCDGDPLSSCLAPDVISPSKYYLENDKKITLIYTDSGTVQLKIDAGTVKLDTYVSYSCSGQTSYVCSVAAPSQGTCTGGPALTVTTNCYGDRCLGGSNSGGVCNSSSACPGGACTVSTTCNNIQVCHGGPQDTKYCGGGTGSVSCLSTNNQSGYKIRLIGNETGGEVTDTLHHLLRGDGSNGEGCVKECDVVLGADGSVNSSGLTPCTYSGDCLHDPLEAIHSVQLLDPDGQILGIPGIGPATIWSYGNTTEPAKSGDCVSNPSQAYCP